MTVAVNNDDDDADQTSDAEDGEVAGGDDDLAELWPAGGVFGLCCPCPAHRAESVMSAALVSGTGNLALYGNAAKTAAFEGTVQSGQPVYVEGAGASPSPWSDRLLWSWTDADNNVHYVTNRFTVLGVRLFGDMDLDGDVDAADRALRSAATNAWGWAMPAATNVFRPVRLRTDVGLSGGRYTLALAGDAGAFRVWSDASGTNAAPLLACGQTVTNGENGVTFLTAADTDLYVEAVSNGTATLTYAYTGTGDAAGISCEASLKMTAWDIGIAMDGDRDGEISFNGTNDTSYIFWVNDDVDAIENGEEDDKESGTADCADSAITCMRDLEDFARLHIRIGADVSCLSGVTYSLKFENVSGTPMVNVFEAVKSTAEYLTATNVAAEQIQKTSLTPDGVFTIEVPIDGQYIKTGGEVSPFLVEGCTPGSGDLTLVVKKDGAEICKKAVRLELHDMSWFYDIYSVSASGERWEVQVNTSAVHSQTAGYQPKTNERLLFVHGWNMEGWEKRRWAETVFKRTWWQGYQGAVALFDWPTLAEFDGFWDVMTNPHHFDNSEYISWQSSDALLGVLNTLNISGSLRVLSHSMGNVVTGEALKRYNGQMNIVAYIACQAALSAHYYDNNVAITNPCQQQSCDLSFPNTPDIIGHFDATGDTNAVPYMANNNLHVTSMFNYYNDVDWALKKWEINNVLKPDNWTPYLFSYDGRAACYKEGVDIFSRGVNPREPLSVTNQCQRCRIFAYCVESRSRALGQVRTDAFQNWRLSGIRSEGGMGYDDRHYSHSREFRSNVAAEHPFWLKVFGDCQYQTP